MGAAEMTRQWGVYIACAESPISATSTQQGRLTTICNSSSKELDATTLGGHPHPSAHTTHRLAHIHIIKENFESRVHINQIQTLIWPVSTDQLFSLRHSNKVRLCAFLPSMQYNMDLHQRHRRLSCKGRQVLQSTTQLSFVKWLRTHQKDREEVRQGINKANGQSSEHPLKGNGLWVAAGTTTAGRAQSDREGPCSHTTQVTSGLFLDFNSQNPTECHV